MGETILSGGDTSTLHQAGDIGEDEHFVSYALKVQRHWTFLQPDSRCDILLLITD